MISEHAGTLPTSSALHHFLEGDVLRRVYGFPLRRSSFEAFHLDHHNSVLRYADTTTRVSLVCKFFARKWISGRPNGEHAECMRLMQREYDNLTRLRAMGFARFPHRAVEPLALAPHLDCLMVEEYVDGRDLDCYVRDAIHCGKRDALFECLADLAWLLADLHSRGAGGGAPDGTDAQAYLVSILDHLAYWHIISEAEHAQLRDCGAAWQSERVLEGIVPTLIHGDPVPPNFLFEGRHKLTFIDVERLKTGDRARDLGCVAAELKHLFWLYGRNPHGSEPYIRHFYASYCELTPPGTEPFDALTERGRYYMGCYLLRICRNSWLEIGYRRGLLGEAMQCLRF